MGFNGFFISCFSLCLEYCCGMGKPQEGITPDNITCKCSTSSVVPMWGPQQAVRLTKLPPTFSGAPWWQSDPRTFGFDRRLPSKSGLGLLSLHPSWLPLT